MKFTSSIVIAVMLVVACRGRDQEPSSHSSGEQPHPTPAMITDSSVGPLRIGMSSDSLARVAPVLQDTTELDNEGNPQRIARVAVASDTVTAEIVDGRVWRMRVTTPRVSTADGIHVGSPARGLATSRDVVGAVGEGKIYVLSPARCGLSFGLPPAIVRPARQLDSAAIAHLPPTAVIDEILVLGCRRTAPR